MSYGFRSENDSGRLQIDENFPNMLVVATGTCTNGDVISFPAGVNENNIQVWARINSANRGDSTTSDGTVYTGKFRIHGHIYRGQSPGDNNKKFRIWCSNVSDYQGPSGGGGQLWNYFLETDPGRNIFSGGGFSAQAGEQAATATTQIDYVVTTQPEEMAVPQTGYGLNVLKENQTLAYSSEYQVMNVIEDIYFELDGSADNPPSDQFFMPDTFPITRTNQPADRYVLVNCTYHFWVRTVAFPGIAIYQGPLWQMDYEAETISIINRVSQTGPAMGRSFFFINFRPDYQRRHFQLGDLSK